MMIVIMDYPTSISGRSVSVGERVEVTESEYAAIRMICHPTRAEPEIKPDDQINRKKGGRHGV